MTATGTVPLAPTRAQAANTVTIPTNSGASQGNAPTAAPGAVACFDQLVQGLAPQSVSVGKHFEELPYRSNLNLVPFVILVTERGVAVGAIHVTVDTAANITYVENVYDARCQPIETFVNSDNPQGDKHIIPDTWTLQVTFSDSAYELSFQVFPESLRVNNIKRVE